MVMMMMLTMVVMMMMMIMMMMTKTAGEIKGQHTYYGKMLSILLSCCLHPLSNSESTSEWCPCDIDNDHLHGHYYAQQRSHNVSISMVAKMQ